MLVADDYPDVAETLAEFIELAATFPVEVAVVHDGAQALVKAISDRPDCAIFDLDMPLLSGLGAALAIRAELGADAPVLIAVTGDSRHSLSPLVLAAFDGFYEKPADAYELIGRIAQARFCRRSAEELDKISAFATLADLAALMPR